MCRVRGGSSLPTLRLSYGATNMARFVFIFLVAIGLVNDIANTALVGPHSNGVYRGANNQSDDDGGGDDQNDDDDDGGDDQVDDGEQQ